MARGCTEVSYHHNDEECTNNNNVRQRSNDPIINNTNNTSPRHHQQNINDKTFLLQQLLCIKLPRCSVCETAWFCDDPMEKDINDFHKDKIEDYIHRKAKELIPMPECSCTTTLINNSSAQELDLILNRKEEDDEEEAQTNTHEASSIGKLSTSNISTSTSAISTSSSSTNNNKKSPNHNVDDTTMLDILLHQSNLSLQDIRLFPLKGMCKQCVQRQMKASTEVFQDGTETNVTVATKCPLCSKKFSSRFLVKRIEHCMSIDSASGKSSSSASKSYSSSLRGKNDVPPSVMAWYDAVVNTLKFVRYTKRLKVRMVQKALTIKSRSNTSKPDDNNNDDGADDDSKCTSYKQQQRIKDIQNVVSLSKDFFDEWHEEEDSDDCFSTCEDEDASYTESSTTATTAQQKNIIAPEKGELRRYYQQQYNPFYEQECKDEQLAKELQDRLNNEKNDEKKVQQERNDAEIARRLHEQMLQNSNTVTPLGKKNKNTIELAFEKQRSLPPAKSDNHRRDSRKQQYSSTARSGFSSSISSSSSSSTTYYANKSSFDIHRYLTKKSAAEIEKDRHRDVLNLLKQKECFDVWSKSNTKASATTTSTCTNTNISSSNMAMRARPIMNMRNYTEVIEPTIELSTSSSSSTTRYNSAFPHKTEIRRTVIDMVSEVARDDREPIDFVNGQIPAALELQRQHVSKRQKRQNVNCQNEDDSNCINNGSKTTTCFGSSDLTKEGVRDSFIQQKANIASQSIVILNDDQMGNSNNPIEIEDL